jgi:ubiquinone/menaquinone biosynthesis C-methylase UbiE
MGSMGYYNTTAPSYNQQYKEEQSRKYEFAFNSLNIVKSDSILDVGCGNGLFIEEIADIAGFVVGVDLSRRMVEIANEKGKDLKNILLICGDADHLPLREKIIDKVFSFTLLQNMPDPKRTIMEMLRVAKAGSDIILSVDKKSFTGEGFRKLIGEVDMVVTSLINTGELKDYLAICTKSF